MIDILLSSHNGEKYIGKQIDSIIDQTCNTWRLLIRDDVSSDKTLDIIHNYQTKYPDKIKIYKGTSNLGACQSFSALLSKSTADYIMFCDQDDVWYPDKIELTIAKMHDIEKISPNIPILIHTDLVVTNSSGDMISNSFWKYQNIPVPYEKKLLHLCLHNVVTGCTMMLNRFAVKASSPILPQAVMHDWWIAIHVCRYGIIDHIPVQTVRYRRHDATATRTFRSSFCHYVRKTIMIRPFYQHLKSKFLMFRFFNFKINVLALIYLQLFLIIKHFALSLNIKSTSR